MSKCISVIGPPPVESIGGSGITSFVLCDILLRRGYQVNLFVEKNVHVQDLDSSWRNDFESLGLQIYEFSAPPESPVGKFGKELLLSFYNYRAYCQMVALFEETLRRSDLVIGRGLGFAAAIAPLKINALSILSDDSHLRYAGSGDGGEPLKGVFNYLRLITMSHAERRLSRDLLGVRCATFVQEQANYWEGKKLKVDLLYYFTQGTSVHNFMDNTNMLNATKLLHVGSLLSTAGKKMWDHWEKEVFPKLSSSDIETELTIIGKSPMDAGHIQKLGSLTIIHKGVMESIDYELSHADFFLCTMPENGLRTRIVHAMSFGLPCIVNELILSSMPQLNSDENVVCIDDHENLAESLLSIRVSPAKINTLRQSARACWEKHWSPGRGVENILHEYLL